jgi:hypothetical protein
MKGMKKALLAPLTFTAPALALDNGQWGRAAMRCRSSPTTPAASPASPGVPSSG